MLVGAGDRGRLGHEVEVEELDEFELDLARGGTRFEEGCDSEKAVESFEGSGVARGINKGNDECQESCGLDGWAVVRFEEIEEELIIH